MAEPKPNFAKQSSARRAQWKEKPCKVREKKEKPQGFAFSLPNCCRLYSKAEGFSVIILSGYLFPVLL